MSDTKAAWDEVGSAFSGLGGKLKAHYEHTRGESQEPSETPPAGTGAPGTATGATDNADAAASTEESTKEERDLKEALHRLTEALSGAFEALGAAVRDPAMKEDVKHVGQSLGTALSTTFADVSDEVRKAFKRSGKEGEEAGTNGSGDAPKPEA